VKDKKYGVSIGHVAQSFPSSWDVCLATFDGGYATSMHEDDKDNLTSTHNQILLSRDPIYDPPTEDNQASSTVDNDMTENSKMWEEQ